MKKVIKYIILIIVLLIILYIIWLSANPISYDENKYEIYNKINNKYKLKTLKINKNNINEIIEKENLIYPLIIKPIICNGAGNGVKKIEKYDDILKYFNNNDDDDEYILQEFYNSKYEVGILYERIPFSNNGKITSITLKPKNINNWKPLLCKTPYNNEEFYCNDITNINTKKLNDVIDNISKNIPNFYVGRYDIGFDNLDDLKNGKNFKIFELNGVVGFDLNFIMTEDKINNIKKIIKLIRWFLIRLFIGFINIISLNIKLKDIILNTQNRIKDTNKCKNWEMMFQPSSA